MFVRMSLALIIVIGASAIGWTSKAEEGVDWSTAARVDYDNGAPENFRRLNGFSACGSSAIALLSEKTRELTIRNLKGEVVEKLDLKNYFESIEGPVGARIVCGSGYRPQIGLMIYSGFGRDGENLDYENVLSVVLDFGGKRPSKLLPMMQLYPGEQLWGLSNSGYIFAFNDLQEPQIVGSVHFAEDGKDFGNLLKTPADRFIVRHHGSQFLCFVARYFTEGDRVKCAALGRVEQLLADAEVEHASFVSVTGDHIFARGLSQLLSCDLSPLECETEMDCNCPDEVGVDYAISSDGIVFQIRESGAGFYGKELPQGQRYIEVLSLQGALIYSVPSNLVDRAEYVEAVPVGKAMFLAIFLKEDSEFTEDPDDGLSAPGRIIFKRIH